MKGDGCVACTSYKLQRGVYAQIGGVAFLGCGQIDGGFGQGNTPLRPAYLLDGIKGSVGQQQRVGIGQPDVLGCRYDEAPGDKFRVFAAGYEAGQPVERGVGVAAANALDVGRDDVVVQLAPFVVGHGIELQLAGHLLVVNNDRRISQCR